MRIPAHLNYWLLAIFATQAVAGSAVASSPKEAVVYNFQGGSDGSYPYAGLVTGRDGTLYGTTTAGGGGTCSGGCGTVFQLTPPATPTGAWAETVLYRFTGGNDGATPWAGLILDSAGNLYGTTIFGGGACRSGCGVVFKLAPPAMPGGAWTQSVLYSFKGVRAGDGDGPEGNLIFDKSGRLNGTTYAGGIACSDSTPTGCGTVFQLSPPAPGSGGTWTESVIYRFDPSFAGGPAAGLILDPQGNLYGTAVNDGVYGEGTAYKLAHASTGAWKRSVLHAFGGSSTDGGYVSAGLTVGKGGALYGATEGYGGEVGDGGTVFQLTPPAPGSGAGWTETVLYVFPGDNGDTRGPFGSLLAGPAGNLFGMTPSGGGGPCQVNGWLGCGMVFALTPPTATGGTWTYTTLHNFAGGADGAIPYSSLTFGLGSALFGTTYGGGSGTCSQPSPTGCGTVVMIVP